MIRIGFIGCGQVTEQLHLSALHSVRDIEIAALADPDGERLQRCAGKSGDPACHQDPDALLRDPSIDIVAVCTPAQFHAEYVHKAIEEGKHVFVEKPLALDLEDCKTLVKAAKTSKGFVTVGFNLRHHRLISRAKTIIHGGKLGRIHLIRSVACGNWKSGGPLADWRKRVKSGGGVLFELGVHHFDLWRFLLNSEIGEISAHNMSHVNEDETTVVLACMKQGMLADAAFSQSTANHNRLDIYGEHGRLRLALERYDGLEFVSSCDQRRAARWRPGNILNSARELPGAVRRQFRGGSFADSYRNQWLALCNSIREGKAPGSTVEDGFAAVRASLSALHSASEKVSI